jgi:hypothetical protein
MSTTIGDIFDIPAAVHHGDFVLRLTEPGGLPPPQGHRGTAQRLDQVGARVSPVQSARH